MCELKQHVNAYSPVHAVPNEVMLYGVSVTLCVARPVVARVSSRYGDSRLAHASRWLVYELKQHVNAFSPVHALLIEGILHDVSVVLCVTRSVVASVSPCYSDSLLAHA